MKYIKYLFLITIFSYSTFCLANNEESPLSIYVNEEQIEQTEITKALFKKKNFTKTNTTYTHQIIAIENKTVTLDDNSKYSIRWYNTSAINQWEVGHKVKVYYPRGLFDNYTIENLDCSSEATFGLDEIDPTSVPVIASVDYKTVTLSDGSRFDAKYFFDIDAWTAHDKVYIYYGSKENHYDIYNMTNEELVRNFKLLESDEESELVKVEIHDPLNLEKRLNQKVLYQSNAVNAVSIALVNYSAGLNNPNTPIGVFLFLGPTGVGKTELAKAVTEELYHDSEKLIRFDMSQFTHQANINRLIGTPPGYINNEKGGQLTEALKMMPQSVVLLDEIEKAHSEIHKFFLPVFDEGYIRDANNVFVSAKDVTFIMTSNLAADTIQSMIQMGYSESEIIKTIEPDLMQALSPELYNRIEPVIFHPLSKESMSRLVEKMLQEVVQRVKNNKSIQVSFDKSVIDYLTDNGFHPLLGARPLKRMIEKKVVSSIAVAIISKKIPAGSKIELSYSAFDDSWHVKY